MFPKRGEITENNCWGIITVLFSKFFYPQGPCSWKLFSDFIVLCGFGVLQIVRYGNHNVASHHDNHVLQSFNFGRSFVPVQLFLEHWLSFSSIILYFLACDHHMHDDKYGFKSLEFFFRLFVLCVSTWKISRLRLGQHSTDAVVKSSLSLVIRGLVSWCGDAK